MYRDPGPCRAEDEAQPCEELHAVFTGNHYNFLTRKPAKEDEALYELSVLDADDELNFDDDEFLMYDFLKHLPTVIALESSSDGDVQKPPKKSKMTTRPSSFTHFVHIT